MEDLDIRMAAANLTLSLILGKKNIPDIDAVLEELPSLDVLDAYANGFFNFLKYGKFDLSK